jgi:hypothetical protein
LEAFLRPNIRVEIVVPGGAIDRQGQGRKLLVNDYRFPGIGIRKRNFTIRATRRWPLNAEGGFAFPNLFQGGVRLVGNDGERILVGKNCAPRPRVADCNIETAREDPVVRRLNEDMQCVIA